jgi:ectoine hydroxylase-related dioxygenase (phytanoyl-CoA dioxygenase family)
MSTLMKNKASKISEADLAFYHEQGYLIRRGAFSAERIAALRAAVDHMLERAYRGEIETREVEGADPEDLEIQWINREKRIVQRIDLMLWPEKYEPAYGAWIAEDLVPDAEVLIGGPVRYSGFGMLASGGGKGYRLGWHRDIGKPGAPDEEEYLRRWHGKLVQVNAPLLPGDRFVEIVPGSHLRASTPAELAVFRAPIGSTEMPGALTVELEPGDIVYYNPNLWHRGWNPRGEMRRTLHTAFWQCDQPVFAHEAGQREALSDPQFLAALPPVTRTLVERFLEAYPKEGRPIPLSKA